MFQSGQRLPSLSRLSIFAASLFFSAMAADADTHWLIPQGIGVSDLAARLKATLRPALAMDQRQRIVLHDTFAWQLWRRGMVLASLDGSFALCHARRLSIDEAIAVCGAAGEVPRFWWDWPAGSLRDQLRSVIGVRALAPVADVTVVTQRIDLRNSDDKTVARVIVQRYMRPGESAEQAIGMCRVVPIRGYDRECWGVQRALRQLGFPHSVTSPVEMILEQSVRRPSTWSAKPECHVSPAMTVREAVRRMAAASLDICRRCEEGIIEDVDTEFLHDYRVSLRRIRSTLKLIKHVYPAGATAEVSADLARCARRTNRLRDLDVYLLNREEYLGCTPPDLKQALGEMFEDLHRERTAEQQAVAAHLGSNAYRSTVQTLSEVFAENKWWPVTVNSHTRVLSLANQVLPKRYGKIRRMHMAIRESSPDGQIHDIRLQAKKLRYLLEFFGALYPPPVSGRLIRRLKKLQNTLGTFNDLAVQQASLREYVDRKSSESRNRKALLLAVGSMLGILHHQQQEVRHQVFRRLAAFAGNETRSLVQSLYKEGSRAA